MKKITRSLLISLFVIIAAPAYSDSGKAIQIFECEFNGDATASQLLDVTAAWLKAARKTKGGKNIDVAIRFPIAEGGDAGGDFRFVIVAPSFSAWGEFTDAYEGSEVEGVDEQLYELADCGQSTIWEGMVIK
ncbi:MAG: hypothetical protein V7742_22825 [Halioglobus sp.]